MFDSDRRYVLSFAAIGAVLIVGAYIILNQGQLNSYLERPDGPVPVTEVCVGENCEENTPSDVPSQGPPAPNETTGTNSTGGGGSWSYVPPQIQLGEGEDLGQACLEAMVAYCDKWDHGLYLPYNLPFGNLTFFEWQPQCEGEFFVREFEQPTPQDCQDFWLNLTAGP